MVSFADMMAQRVNNSRPEAQAVPAPEVAPAAAPAVAANDASAPAYAESQSVNSLLAGILGAPQNDAPASAQQAIASPQAKIAIVGSKPERERHVTARRNEALSASLAAPVIHAIQAGTNQDATRIFVALTQRVEGCQTHVYNDVGFASVGYGYCITKRRAEYGDERVYQDLSRAGIDDKTVRMLMSDSALQRSRASITQEQAVRLLGETERDYRALARNATGGEAFDRLSPSQQAALTYMAYNVGGPTPLEPGHKGIYGFKTLLNAVRQGDHQTVVREMDIKYYDPGTGRVETNHRAQGWIATAYTGERHLVNALSNAQTAEAHFRRGDVFAFAGDQAPTTARRAAHGASI